MTRLILRRGFRMTANADSKMTIPILTDGGGVGAKSRRGGASARMAVERAWVEMKDWSDAFLSRSL